MSYYEQLDEKRECDLCDKNRVIWKCSINAITVYACKKCVREELLK